MKYTPDNTTEIGKPVNVYLNGVAQEHVYEADPEKGYIVRAKLKDGLIYGDGYGNIAKERITGTVRVVPA